MESQVDRQVYQQKVEAQLTKLNAQIEEYKAKVKQSQAEATVQYYDQLEELSVKRDAVQQKLENLQKASESAWQEMQQGFETAWDDLAKSFDGAVKHINDALS